MLIAAEKPPSVVGNIAAGVYSGLATVIDAAAFTSIVFGPVGLPLTIGLQHALLGFVAMQTVVTRFAGTGFLLAPTSYEVMPFLARFASIVAAAGVGGASLLATVLTGSVLVGLLGALLVLAAAEAPVNDVEKLLPPKLQAGLFAAIGWSLYMLAFDSLGLRFSLSASMLDWASARLWLPANALGLGLWFTARRVNSPYLFPGFVAGVTGLVHAVRCWTGTSIADARAAGWLMSEAAGGPVTQLYLAFSPELVRWDLIFSPAGFSALLSAALFGPVINTVLNYILAGPLFKRKLDLRRELRTHAAGAAAAAVGGGYSSYIALSNTAIHLRYMERRFGVHGPSDDCHSLTLMAIGGPDDSYVALSDAVMYRRVGGMTKFSTYVAAAVGALFLIAYPLCACVGYVPTLVIGAICVFIGAAFLHDNLVVPLGAALNESAEGKGLTFEAVRLALGSVAASWLVLLICVKQNMLLGTVLGVLGFQAAGYLKQRQQGGGM